ncbi:MAG: HAD family phosphatase, partial [Rubrobacteraceae bacterium]|nr:HAD family phosphatase [Rubrobacteraceae bacterium]
RAARELRPTLREAEVVDAFKDYVGLSRQDVATGLMVRFGLEDAAKARMEEFGVESPWQAFVQIRLRVYERLLADHDLIVANRYPHNIAVLHEVRRLGYLTALSTMSHPGQVRHVLAILGLAEEFDVVATRDDVERGKPDPEIDLLVASELGVEPRECLVFEDSPAGVEAGLAAGMDVIAVTTGLTHEKFEGTALRDRCLVVDDPRELPAAVRSVIPDYGG